MAEQTVEQAIEFYARGNGQFAIAYALLQLAHAVEEIESNAGALEFIGEQLRDGLAKPPP